MTETRVVHVRDNIPGAIYIGRAMPRQGLKASVFANPYKIGKPDRVDGRPMARYAVLRCYAEDLISGGKKRHLLSLLPALRNAPIACWCRHDGDEIDLFTNACHGDILVSYLGRYTDEELRVMANDH